MIGKLLGTPFRTDTAIARIQAAKELLSRKPADPEPEPEQGSRGVYLPKLIDLAREVRIEVATLDDVVAYAREVALSGGWPS
jgi:hypothetical protein